MTTIQVRTEGDFAVNCYIVNTDSGCVIIDAPWPADGIIRQLESKSARPELVVLTHGHFDHILGLGRLKESFPQIKIAVSRTDSTMLDLDIIRRDMGFFGLDCPVSSIPQADILLCGGDRPFSDFQVIETPGHTAGSISLYSENDLILFSGDTLFRYTLSKLFSRTTPRQQQKRHQEKDGCRRRRERKTFSVFELFAFALVPVLHRAMISHHSAVDFCFRSALTHFHSPR